MKWGITNVKKAVRKSWQAWAKGWGVGVPIIALIPAVKGQMEQWGWTAIAAIAAICMTIGYWRSRRRRRIELKLGKAGATIEVEVGNIFDSDGVKIIPVNNYFDSRIGQAVSQQSLHGALIERNKGGYGEVQKRLRKGPEGKEPMATQVERGREGGKADEYEIGTYVTIIGETASEAYVAVALSKTDPETLVAKADIGDLCKAIVGACKGARETSNGRDVCFPLMGAGLSKTGIMPQQLLDMLVEVIRLEADKQEVAKRIKIVLEEAVWERIDLEAIQRRWEQ